jgi:hypothetical protein
MSPSKSVNLPFCFFFTLALSFFSSVAFPQTPQPYFPGSYSQQPVITFKEGFLNKTTYYLDGEEASSKQVGLLLNSVQTDGFRFLPNQRKKNLGSGLMLTGLAINLGSIGYLFSNEITQATIRPWFLVTFGSGFLQVAGNSMSRNSERKIERTLTNFNAYHYSKGPGAYLSMELSESFIGSKIEIYEGPMLLKNDQVLARLKSNEEAYRMFEQVTKRQKVSTATNVMNSAIGLGIMVVVLGFDRQSTPQNQILLPMTFTGIGLNVFSSFFERRTRNLTREALHRYNYQ